MQPESFNIRFSVPDGHEIDPEDIARQLGIPVSQLPVDLLEFLKGACENIRRDKAAVRRAITPFYDQALASKASANRLNEMIDIGKFIHHNTLPLQLIEVGESPDFILDFQGERIGIEHTQLFNQTEQHQLGKTISFLESARRIILNVAPAIVGLYNIQLRIDRIALPGRRFLDLEKFELKPFARQLADYIINLTVNTSMPRPDFIDALTYYPKKDLILSLSEEFIKGQLQTATIIDRIEKKEAKIAAYLSGKNLSACWLLLVYNTSISSSSFFIDLTALPSHLVKFDRLFLLDSYQGTIIEGKVIR